MRSRLPSHWLFDASCPVHSYSFLQTMLRDEAFPL